MRKRNLTPRKLDYSSTLPTVSHEPSHDKWPLFRKSEISLYRQVLIQALIIVSATSAVYLVNTLFSVLVPMVMSIIGPEWTLAGPAYLFWVFGLYFLIRERVSHNDSRIPRQRSNQYTVTEPKAAAFLLFVFLEQNDRKTIPGDLQEEFQTTILPQFGPRRAKFWYWSQVLTTIIYRNPIIKWALAGGGILELAVRLIRRISG